ncbi:MAG: EAL domain-containing protein [Methylococcaceae bacterium]
MNYKLLLSFSLVLIIANLAYLIAVNFFSWQVEIYYHYGLLLLAIITMSALLYSSYQERKIKLQLEEQIEEQTQQILSRKVVLQAKDNTDQPNGNQAYKSSQTSDQLLVNYFPNFLCIKDHENRWLAASYEYLSMFNLEQADYWGKTDQELATHYPDSNVLELKTSAIQDKSAWYQRTKMTETRKMSTAGREEAWIITRTPVFDRYQNRFKLLITGNFISEDKSNAARLTRVADAFNEGHLSFAFLDRNFLITDINDTFSQLTGYRANEVEDKALSMLIDGKFEINPADFFKDNNKQCWSGECRCKRKDGNLFPLKLDITAITKDNKATIYFASLLDITRQKQVEKRIMQLSYYDDLTGLPNRVMFLDRLSRIVSTPVEQNNNYAVVIFIDLDRFKGVNDSLGHDAGNALLKETAKRLVSLIKKGDLVARFNGDEFAILLNNEASYQQASYAATLLAGKIIQLLASEFSLYSHQKLRQVFVSASVGLAVYPEDGLSAEVLLKNADIAMYKAKSEGGNNYQFYKKNSAISAHERLELEADLRKAQSRGELQLYYQPQYDAVTREICGAEVLVRWFRNGKIIPPDYFIYIAEETDLIIEMGAWILQTACQKMKQWLAAGYPLPRISVNVAARQFADANFLKLVTNVLEDTKLEAHYLELEITESTLVGDIKRIELQLHRLKKMGIHIALDDFGTGYSSLSYLKNFPIDMLKIDKSFIMEMTKDSKDAQIARAIIEMGHSLGQKIIAEGVETEEQLMYLAHRGCDIIQGYYFSVPLSADKMTALLRNEAEGAGFNKRKTKALFE